MRKLLIAVGLSAATAWVGLLGTWAFNPDNGALLRSDLLWRVFGVPGELAWVATPVLVVLLVFAVVARFCRLAWE